jgi:hypothetical protein
MVRDLPRLPWDNAKVSFEVDPLGVLWLLVVRKKRIRNEIQRELSLYSLESSWASQWREVPEVNWPWPPHGPDEVDEGVHLLASSSKALVIHFQAKEVSDRQFEHTVMLLDMSSFSYDPDLPYDPLEKYCNDFHTFTARVREPPLACTGAHASQFLFQFQYEGSCHALEMEDERWIFTRPHVHLGDAFSRDLLVKRKFGTESLFNFGGRHIYFVRKLNCSSTPVGSLYNKNEQDFQGWIDCFDTSTRQIQRFYDVADEKIEEGEEEEEEEG